MTRPARKELRLRCSHTRGDTLSVMGFPFTGSTVRFNAMRENGLAVPVVLNARDTKRLRDRLTVLVRALPAPRPKPRRKS